MVIKLYGYDKENKEVYVGSFTSQNAAQIAVKNLKLKSYFFYREKNFFQGEKKLFNPHVCL